jgi:hypothetical protein
LDGDPSDQGGEVGHTAHEGISIRGGERSRDARELVVAQLGDEADRDIAEERVELPGVGLHHEGIIGTNG